MKRATLMLLTLLASGCGVEITPSSEVESLRILGVSKDRPYARPGEVVTLRMLWHDGGPEQGRPIERLWVSGCFNPLADLYSGCFAVAPEPSSITVGQGDEFSFTLPENLIEAHGRSLDPKQPPYGVAFVFFAACAGQLELAAQGARFPLRCTGEDGKERGPDDFVAGYSQIFAYESLRNENPRLLGFRLNGQAVSPDCVGVGCLGLDTEAPDCAQRPELCIAACPKDGDPSCAAIGIQAEADPASIEADDLAALAGRSLQEQVWMTYHVDRGSVAAGAKLVNDPERGFNAKHGTELYAPSEPGPLRIWGVLRDNRGGSDWLRLTLTVR